MVTPLVSIIVPLYNRENFINTCILSIINQKYLNWEAIIVDDGSTDNSIANVEKFLQDDRIRLIKRNRTPKGAPTCRNIGIDNAKGEFIIFLDSDDYLDENCLLNRVNLMLQNLNLDFLVFNMRIHEGKKIKLWNVNVNDEDDIIRFLRGDGVWPITGPIFKKKIFEEHIFDESLPFWQDYIFHIILLLNDIPYKSYLHIIDSNHIRHTSESISQKGFQSIEKTLKRCDLLFGIFKILNEKNASKSHYLVLLIHYVKTTTIFLHYHNYKLYYILNKKLFDVKGLMKGETIKLIIFLLLMSVNNKFFSHVFARGFRVLFINKKFNHLIWKPILMGKNLAPEHLYENLKF